MPERWGKCGETDLPTEILEWKVFLCVWKLWHSSLSDAICWTSWAFKVSANWAILSIYTDTHYLVCFWKQNRGLDFKKLHRFSLLYTSLTRTDAWGMTDISLDGFCSNLLYSYSACCHTAAAEIWWTFVLCLPQWPNTLGLNAGSTLCELDILPSVSLQASWSKNQSWCSGQVSLGWSSCEI